MQKGAKKGKASVEWRRPGKAGAEGGGAGSRKAERGSGCRSSAGAPASCPPPPRNHPEEARERGQPGKDDWRRHLTPREEPGRPGVPSGWRAPARRWLTPVITANGGEAGAPPLPPRRVRHARGALGGRARGRGAALLRDASSPST